ncbi:MAG: PHP domain-containing protein [Clostridium sp.]
MKNKGDFHMHSTVSDGNNTPHELLIIAKNKHVNFLSLTDHDNTDGIKEILKYAHSLGIKVIPAIELSTVYNNENIHVLGYFRDNSYERREFQETLSSIRKEREIRAEKIIENLKHYFNIHISYKELYENSQGTIARPHIAKAIINKGYSYSYEYLFNNIINNNSPAYVPYKRIPTKDGITLLKKFNAVTVLAHPVLIKKTPVEDILNLGFDGIEAIYPLNTYEDELRFKSLAKKLNLFITAGSDFHGFFKDDTKHGDLGHVSLSNDDLDRFIEILNYK